MPGLSQLLFHHRFFFFFQAEDGIRDTSVTGVQTCALPIYLGKTCAATELESLSDDKLVERFLRARDEAAFAVLMHRHGPMVMAVCRRVLGDGPNADDAFQRSEERRVGKECR